MVLRKIQNHRLWPFLGDQLSPKSTQNMAVAIWVMIGVVMSVLGGVGAFSFHLWRHANTPLTPDKELTDEDLSQYE